MLMKVLQNYFNSGNLYKYSEKSAVVLEIFKFSDIYSTLLPFFNKYPVIGSKHLDFLDFENAAHIIKNKEHLKKEGLEKILSLKKRVTLRKLNNVSNNHNSDQGSDNLDLKR